MDKTHFYERLARWQHLRFTDVIVRERPDTQAWEKKYEIYIQDKIKSSAQLYIRTTQPGEDVTTVKLAYLAWLQEYNGMESVANASGDGVSSRQKLTESCTSLSGNRQTRFHLPRSAAGLNRSL